MMRRLLLLIGLTLLPPIASAADTDLYDLFRSQVEKESGKEKTDAPVIEFLQGVYEERWSLSEDEMKGAVLGQPWKACVSDDAEAVQQNTAECDRALRNIQLLALEEQQLRVFGRSLLRISAAQELPLTEFPGRPFHLTTDLSGIINIWRAGTGSVRHTMSGAMMVRTKTLTDEEVGRIEEAFNQVAGSVKIDEGGQNNEYGIAQMWYYQYGARLRSGARSPTFPPPLNDGLSGPGTERQYLFKDDFKAGKFLEALWSKLPRDRTAFDPPLSANEVAYFLFPDKLTDLLPENVVVWARMDAGAYTPGVGEDYPLGDAGLAWKYPIEPVLPSLLKVAYEPGVGDSTKPILGGRYPPEPATERYSDDNGQPLPPGTKEPIDGRGLCSMAVAQRGYLCRPYRTTDEQRCPRDEEQSDDENVITLVSCTLEDEPTLTVAGADVCREIGWLNNEQQQRCNVEFTPGPCLNGDAGVTNEKQPDGTIQICLDDSVDAPPLTYVQEHEMVHAMQYCSLPAGNVYAGLDDEQTAALCCRLEGEAHLVNCKRMAEDGLLKHPDGSAFKLNSVEITPQLCMEMLRNVTCSTFRNREITCPLSVQFGPEDAKALYQHLSTVGNPKNLPDTYEEAIDPETMDARIAARLRTIERQIPICTPGTETTYKNTIGNNACYIGQCVEETLELHRVTAGRSPAVVGDGAFPHDDPNTGDALATLLRSVPATSPPLPSYRPQLIARIFDDALCQLQGMPAATPPHLCAFSPSRRLALPLGNGSMTARGIVSGGQEQREATLLTEQLASGLGSRIGTDMQGQYLRIGTRTLSEVVGLANTLLREALTVTFPTNMCPLSL